MRRYDHLVRDDRVTIRDAAWEAMDEAYAKASDNGRLPVRPRQIMYAARPQILALTGKDHLDDRYFTQTLLPDYLNEYSHCQNWDIVWDARGHFSEPHTGREIGLGTLEVREYLGLRPERSDAINVDRSVLYPTFGPNTDSTPSCLSRRKGSIRCSPPSTWPSGTTWRSCRPRE